MTTITRIDAQVKTGNRVGAGTDGDAYIGIGGSKFFIDSAVDDFEAGADRVYTFGRGVDRLPSAPQRPACAVPAYDREPGPVPGLRSLRAGCGARAGSRR